MKKLLEEMEKNAQLKEKIEKLDQDPKSAPKDYMELAAEYGIELKEEDFKPAGEQGGLTENDLDAVAGGGECYCAVGGGGTASYSSDACGCVLGGAGTYDLGLVRCTCVIGGCGTDH